MSAVTCDRCRGWLIGDADTVGAHADVVAHLGACAECRAFAEALRSGELAWRTEDHGTFHDGVLARTSEADRLALELRSLAEMDPGPGFTQRVLLHTSQRPAAERWRAQWAGVWRALVCRPRFAWEVAYAATLCLVLAAGSPVGAWEWGSQHVKAIAQQPIGRAATSLRQDLETWRAILVADAPAGPAVPEQAGQPTAPSPDAFEAAWQSASNWVRSQLAPVVDGFIDLWQRAATWITGPEPARPPAAGTEPRGDSARSAK